MKVANRKHRVFINEMILHNDQLRAYKAAYHGVSDATAAANSYRLLKNAIVSDAIQKGLDEKEEVVRRVRLEETERLAREQIVTETQLDAQLSMIAIGKAKVTRKVSAFNKEGKLLVSTIEDSPSFSEMVSAINLLFKRKGSYAPMGMKHEAGDSFVEMLRTLSKINSKTKADYQASSGGSKIENHGKQ
ncbi:MAG: terminase small subunit [Chitinophagaceae bacterium]